MAMSHFSMSKLISFCFLITSALLIKEALAGRTIYRETQNTRQSSKNTTMNDYSSFALPGPCSSTTFTISYTPTNDESKTFGNSLPLIITLPNCTLNSSLATANGFTPPFPVVFLYNGFQSKASWYHLITKKLSNWGYVVIQYDTPLFKTPTIASEMDLFKNLLSFIDQQSSKSPFSRLKNTIDTSKLVVSGHSRGGKLAALIFAMNPQVKACWLIDPIDASQWAPESADNPSAIKALKASGKRIGITGAGILSSCNPKEGNYEVFFGGAAPGSWEEFLPNVSHSQFSDGGSLINTAQDALCGSGSETRVSVAELISVPMLSWFWKELRDVGMGVAPLEDPLPSFFSWVKKEESMGKMQFEITSMSKSADEALLREGHVYFFKG